MVGPGLITFSQQILVSKLLLVLNYDHHLKLCIKKKKTKNQPKKTMSGTMNFGSPNLTKPKKEKKKEDEYNKMIQHFHKKTRFIPS